MKIMTVGGNDNARQFFRDKGWEDFGTKVSAPVRARGGGAEQQPAVAATAIVHTHTHMRTCPHTPPYATASRVTSRMRAGR